MRRYVLLYAAIVVLTTFAPLTVTASPMSAAASTTSCHVPHLTDVTVSVARARARAADCRLRLIGAPISMPMVQTIHTQSVRPGLFARVVTLDVNPVCGGAINPGPPPGEPIITSGGPELVTGLFIEGGAYIERSEPHCKPLFGVSSAGTITVTTLGGGVFATLTLTAGQLMYVDVPVGSYSVSGVFAGGNKVGPIIVNVGADQVVRQDLVLDVP